MRPSAACLPLITLLAAVPLRAQQLTLPEKITAGKALTLSTEGSGPATLYIAGTGQALKREIQLGSTITLPAGTLYSAGHYTVVLAAASALQARDLTVTAEATPAHISFLARPSRLPVGVHDGISGAAYLFDSYRNLITTPVPVTFQLSVGSSAPVTRTVNSSNGAAWTLLDSAPHQGAARFVATAGRAETARIIQQVPGDPCSIRLTARPAGQKVIVETDPLRDCGGNPVPDGTIVTITETHEGQRTSADVPLKRGVARVEMPAYAGASISAASGVVLGNDIRLGRQP